MKRCLNCGADIMASGLCSALCKCDHDAPDNFLLEGVKSFTCYICGMAVDIEHWKARMKIKYPYYISFASIKNEKAAEERTATV